MIGIIIAFCFLNLAFPFGVKLRADIDYFLIIKRETSFKNDDLTC